MLNASYTFHLDSLLVAFGSKPWISIDKEVPRALLISVRLRLELNKLPVI